MLLTRLTCLLGAALVSVGFKVSENPARRQEDAGLTARPTISWDEYSLKINGERIFIFSGEVHPFRLPVHGLWPDVFQKVKALGFTAASFYTHWGLHEAKQGEVSFDGFLDLQPFFDAAKDAGLYLIARPGPYINAETAGGGFPGWGVRDTGLWRTSNATYVAAYQKYMRAVSAIIAKNQITNGGPIILYQPENEYSGYWPPTTEDFDYENELLKLLDESGINIPTISNDVWPGGHFKSVDIYGHDSYPNGFDCAHPYDWTNSVPLDFWQSHLVNSPEDPYTVPEFQGGGFDPWGSEGSYEGCAQRLGPEFERIFYKNQYSIATQIFNIYMLFGGTNWGGIAHPGVYTSYDYGSAIAEDRTLREKYYELKLQAQFLAATPAFTTMRPINFDSTNAAFTGDSGLNTTQTQDAVGDKKTTFYTVRQYDSTSYNVKTYKLTVPSSAGDLTLPALGGSLTLSGRDSKIHVVDYQAGNTTILYSTGEIFTWLTVDGKDVVFVYGSIGELHETAFTFSGPAPTPKVVSGSGQISTGPVGSGSIAVQYVTNAGQTVVEVGPKTLLFILDRATAYNFWVLHPPTSKEGYFSKKNPVVVKGGYLIRSVETSPTGLSIKGDLNGTSEFEVIAPAASLKSISFNGKILKTTSTTYGTVIGSLKADIPSVALPDLTKLKWKAADSLPEISSTYSDSKWTNANLKNTTNPRPLTTTWNLYASDYGYHTGNILWRGHFNSSGAETGINIQAQGGTGFGYSVWLDSTFLGSFYGNGANTTWPLELSFSALPAGSAHIITLLQDHMGLEQDWWAAQDDFKQPRGILNFELVGGDTASVLWKVQGNLGGENFADKTRGALNEGGLYAERQGWHLPGFKDANWTSSSPFQGISKAGIGFYRTTFNLNIPSGVDYPMALVATNSTVGPHLRSKFYVNGYQFGKYVNSLGPQKSFPVPQGILNYKGENTLAVALWGLDAEGAKLDGLSLKFTAQIQGGIGEIQNAPLTPWSKRPNAV